jgi:hypothetical protein
MDFVVSFAQNNRNEYHKAHSINLFRVKMLALCDGCAYLWEVLHQEVPDSGGLRHIDAHAGNVRLVFCPAHVDSMRAQAMWEHHI